jgi:hypothetical protein
MLNSSTKARYKKNHQSSFWLQQASVWLLARKSVVRILSYKN